MHAAPYIIAIYDLQTILRLQNMFATSLYAGLRQSNIGTWFNVFRMRSITINDSLRPNLSEGFAGLLKIAQFYICINGFTIIV